MKDLSLSTLIWLRMVRFVQNSNQMSNTHLRRFDLTIAQFEMLSHIRADEPVTQSDLAKGLTVSGGGVSRMVSRLERDGLISRKQDWKTKFISLTAAGRLRLAQAYPAQVEFQSALFDEALDEEEKTQLHALMKKLYEHSMTRREDEEQA